MPNLLRERYSQCVYASNALTFLLVKLLIMKKIAIFVVTIFIAQLGFAHPFENESNKTSLQSVLAQGHYDFAYRLLTHVPIEELEPWHLTDGKNAIDYLLNIKKEQHKNLSKWLTKFIRSGSKNQIRYLLADPHTNEALQEHPKIARLITKRLESKIKKVQPMNDGKRPLGILNGGNTCYANAVMQLLMLLEETFWSSAQAETKFADASFGKGLFVNSIFDFRKSWQSGYADRVTNRQKLRAIIDTGLDNSVFTFKTRYGQEDATEFLQGITQYLAAPDYPQFNLASTIKFTYFGEDKERTRMEPIPTGIELPMSRTIQSPRGAVTHINELFKSYFAVDKLEGENQYSYKGNLYNADKYLRLTGEGNYLLVSLKRFYIDNKLTRRKINAKIDFGDGNLNLSDYIVGSGPYDGKFEIIGIVMHLGTAHGGHYTARVKNDFTWYKVDDGQVKKTNWTEVRHSAQKNGYLMLLKRI